MSAKDDLNGITIGGIYSCAVSLLVPDHLKDVTDADRLELERIYNELYVIQQRVVHGYDVRAADARFERMLASKVRR